ncbi:MAG: hypothetical protein AB4426_27610 [Xenococcaceae cyanobacterium]
MGLISFDYLRRFRTIDQTGGGAEALLRDMSETGRKTLVISLHSLEFARSHCTRLVGVRQGQIVFDVPSAALSPTMIEALYNVSSG